MDDVKISELPAVTVVNGTEDHLVNQGGVTKRQATDQTKAFVLNGGQTGTIAVVTNLNKAVNILQKKERTLTFTNGILTDRGTESAWIDVGEFGDAGSGSGSGSGP